MKPVHQYFSDKFVAPGLVSERWWWSIVTAQNFKYANIFKIGNIMDLTMDDAVAKYRLDLMIAALDGIYGSRGVDYELVVNQNGSVFIPKDVNNASYAVNPYIVVLTHDETWKVISRLTSDTGRLLYRHIGTDTRI